MFFPKSDFSVGLESVPTAATIIKYILVTFASAGVCWC